MTATDTEAALLAAIRENPGEDAPRLVLADWLAGAGRELEAIMQRIIAQPGRDEWRLDYAAELERMAGTVACELCNGKGYFSVRERGEYGPNQYQQDCLACRGTRRVSDGRAELAAFVRVQVELAARDDERCRCRECQTTGQHTNGPCRSPLKPLRRRERELWPTVRGMFGSPDWVASISDPPSIHDLNMPTSRRQPLVLVSRGLPAVVRCTLAEWMGGECAACGGTRLVQHRPPRGASFDAMGSVENCPACYGTGHTPGIGPRLAQRWPIERVEVVDITDFGFDSDGLWLAANLPSDLTGKIPNHGIFPTDDGRSFADWMSDALLVWARGQEVEEER